MPPTACKAASVSWVTETEGHTSDISKVQEVARLLGQSGQAQGKNTPLLQEAQSMEGKRGSQVVLDRGQEQLPRIKCWAHKRVLVLELGFWWLVQE